MTKSQRRFRLTVQGWQNLVLAAMGIVVFAGAVTGSVLLNRTDEVSRELIDHIQPARVAAYRLQAALGDQETATRGYAIAADRQFLEPYYDGRQAEKVAADTIRERLGDRRDLIADVDAIQRAAERWRSTYAEPLIASITPGAPGVIDGTTVDRGKTEFDGMRLLFELQNQHLTTARQDAIGDLDQARAWRDRVLVAMVAAFLVMAIALAILVRSAITRPLTALAAACRRITEGNFDEKIAAHGPKDIRRIALDVENMRQRIVADLVASQAAREQLDEQTVELRRSN
ncbi:MAG: multi-sensor signal transduction histidine kinase, partial [Mycobacterium sp.]|nr:multi-sensor signal transduction histidine kinase [Mycobacterium sp.]